MQFEVKTPHFKYILSIKESFTPHQYTFFVGDKTNKCLEAIMMMPDVEDRFKDEIKTVQLTRIDALDACILSEQDSEDESFGTELLYSFINILKANYSYVKYLRLYDVSYIPCNRDLNQTLDLLTYDIALYGKSWYEMKAGAHLETPKLNKKYEDEIKIWMSDIIKKKYTFDTWKDYVFIQNTDAKELVLFNEMSVKDAWDTSPTFPIFFKKISKIVTKENKCIFFKTWLQEFIKLYVHIERTWIIDIDKNETLKNVLNISEKKPMRASATKTRKTTRIAQKT